MDEVGVEGEEVEAEEEAAEVGGEGVEVDEAGGGGGGNHPSLGEEKEGK